MELSIHFENTLTLGNSLICLVDDINTTSTYGHTASKKRVLYNINLLGDIINKSAFYKQLSRSKNGLTTLFSLGRYIVILKMKKDKTKMEMYFLYFRVEYSVVDEGFDGMFSEKIKTEFQRIKYYMEEWFDDTFDNVSISTSINILG